MQGEKLSHKTTNLQENNLSMQNVEGTKSISRGVHFQKNSSEKNASTEHLLQFDPTRNSDLREKSPSNELQPELRGGSIRKRRSADALRTTVDGSLLNSPGKFFFVVFLLSQFSSSTSKNIKIAFFYRKNESADTEFGRTGAKYHRPATYTECNRSKFHKCAIAAFQFGEL